jgi:NADP-dependent 3-hydroxy acid dehydrogenase YdfG
MSAAQRKVVAIAGASSGSGKAMAELLTAAGYPVALAARRGPLLEEIAASITATGGRAVAVEADMGIWEQARGFVERTVEEYGRLDVLINNAGWGIRAAEFDQLSLEEMNQGFTGRAVPHRDGGACKHLEPGSDISRANHRSDLRRKV